MAYQPDKLVLVCDRCFRATCYYGEFMCDDATDAGTGMLTVAELRRLDREHSDYWTNAYFEKVYGTTHPDFGSEPRLSPPPPSRERAESGRASP